MKPLLPVSRKPANRVNPEKCRYTEVKRVLLVVSGVVQGVGFRKFIEQAAGELNLSGWVRNLQDGTVEIDAQGPDQRLETLIKKAGSGPSRSRVTGISRKELQPVQMHEGFFIRF